jgi:hypothetical protein
MRGTSDSRLAIWHVRSACFVGDVCDRVISLVGLDKRGRLHFRAGHGDRWGITATDQTR